MFSDPETLIFLHQFTYRFSLISEVLDSNTKLSPVFKIHYKHILSCLSAENIMYIKNFDLHYLIAWSLP